jgi:hypothetical protein
MMKATLPTGLVSARLGPIGPIGPQPGDGIVAIPYTAVAPKLDVDGNPLKNFAGAMVQMKGPGDEDFADVIFVPVQETTAVLVVSEDGTYQIRNVPASIGSVDMTNGSSALVYGDPSPPSVENVQCTPPAAPPAGVIGPLSLLPNQPTLEQ